MVVAVAAAVVVVNIVVVSKCNLCGVVSQANSGALSRLLIKKPKNRVFPARMVCLNYVSCWYTIQAGNPRNIKLIK